MNKEMAKFILQGLLERVASDRTNTFLSKVEVRALQRLLEGESELTPEPASEIQPEPEVDFQPDTASGDSARTVKWISEIDPGNEILVCIDFGTSFSKAYAVKGEDPEETPQLISIDLSANAEGLERLVLPSEMLVHGKMIYLGVDARNTFQDIEADQKCLIDNPKQFMTLSEDVSKLKMQKLSANQDPHGILTKRDALVLFLSHLIRMVDKSLASIGIPQPVSMRYTHPAWERFAELNQKEMNRIVAEAIALSRCFPSNFETKLNIDLASEILVSAREAEDEDLPFSILRNPVAEATAAGAGALMEVQEGTGRQHFVIVDIGAGTTDVTGCVCVNRAVDERAKIWEMGDARHSIKFAGNILDNVLQRFILNRSMLTRDSTEYSEAEKSLGKIIRREKETLFNEKWIAVELNTGQEIELSLDEFLKDHHVIQIFDSIKEIIIKSALVVHEKGVPEIFLVPTGGGANLPLIDDLVSDSISRDGKKFKFHLREAMPEQLKNEYSNLIPYYPRLAVAIGGAHPALPEQMTTIANLSDDPGPSRVATTKSWWSR